MYVAAKMLLAGWQVFYSAEARVYHSHDYRYPQELRRYFDIGVFHARDAWLIEKFGRALGEGKQFLCSEIKYVSRRHFFLLFSVFWRTALKMMGYQLGLKERYLPRALKAKLSMQEKFWSEENKE
jgi:rhamnosyltransferase